MQSLHELAPGASSEEVVYLAHEIAQQTESLAREFEMGTEPLYHNFLVNIGLKQKGLCYHWADALYSYFQMQHFPSFSFHLAGANIGEYWREHNAFVVVGRGARVEDGVVIDPWRVGGRLFFVKLKEDKAYQWVHRPSRGCGR